MEELEKLEYPKPLRDFVYQTFNAFADRHPWVGEENIRPKSIAREMFEHFRSFAEYVLDYELQRVGGPAAAPSQQRLQGAQPDRAGRREDGRGARDGGVPAHAAAPGGLEPRRRVGADAGPRLPAARGGGDGAWTPAARRRGGGAGHHPRHEDVHGGHPHPRLHVPPRLVHRRRRRRRSRRWPRQHDARGRAVDARAAASGARRLPRRARAACAWTRRPGTSATRTCRPPTSQQTWRVQQMLVDPEMHNDWVAEFEVDLAASREAREPVIRLLRLGSLM